MSLRYDEVTGISEADFNALASATDNFSRQVIVQRHSPTFTLHGDTLSGRTSAMLFSAEADSTQIIRAYNDNLGSIYVDSLAVESDNQAALNSWSTESVLSALAVIGIAPKVVRQDSGWDIFVFETDGKIHRYSSVDGASWSDAEFSAITIPTDGTVRMFTYGGGIEVIYYWLWDSVTSTYGLWHITPDFLVAFTTGIRWFDAPRALDCVKYLDDSDDKNHLVADSDIRHAVTMSMPQPPMYTYTNEETTVTKTMQAAGGLISFIVRPPLADRIVQFSNEHPIHVFDKETDLQYRSTIHVSGMSSSFAADNPADTLWVASIGKDGDHNTNDASFGFNALYYYSSRDNKHWSQDRIVPFDDPADLANFSSGAQLLRCGNYIYLISALTTWRSAATSEFGSVHPDNAMDITRRITDHSIQIGEMRSTSLALDNRQSVLNNTMLLDSGAMSLITKLGGRLPSGEYMYQVSLEDVDTVEPHQEKPREQVSLQARDRMAWITDRVASADSIEHDGIIVGVDIYRHLGGAENSGMSHTLTAAGTFGTDSHTLKLKSNYKEGIAFKTFKNLIANGSQQSAFVIPKPESHSAPGETVTNGNNHAYAGFVFRAVDKDNFWWIRYDYWAQSFVVGYRKNGKEHPEVAWAAPSWLISQANNELPFTFRIEFRYNVLRVFTKNSDGNLTFFAEYTLRGRSAITASMQQGYAGLFGSGFSDEDTGELEPDPIILTTDGPPANVIPSRLLILMGDGRLIRATGTDSLTGVPNYSVAAGPSPVGGPRSLSNDPYEPDTMMILDSGAIRKVRTVWDTPDESTVWLASTPTDNIGWTYEYAKGNLIGSINRQGYFGWMCYVFRDGDIHDDYLYTTDDFETVKSTHVGTGANYPDAVMSVVPGLFNTNSKGVIYLDNGTGNGAGSFVYKSTTWGASFSALVNAGQYGGGLNIFYKKIDGSDNTDDEFMMVRTEVPYGHSPRYVLVQSNGAYTEFADPPEGAPTRDYHNPHRLSISTDNGKYQACVNSDYSLYITDDGWATKVVKTPPGGAHGVSGYPPSPDYYVTWNGNGIQMTFDRGDTWTDLGAGLASWWATNIGTAEPGVVYVYADLAEFYDLPKWNGA